MHKTLVQWHESAPDNTPLRWHEPGEVADLSHVADLDDLERSGTVVEVGVETLPVRPPEFQPAHEIQDGEAAG